MQVTDNQLLQIAFKQAQEDRIIEYDGLKLDPKTMYFIPLVNKASQKIGLRLYTDNYAPGNKKDFLTTSYIALNSILAKNQLLQIFGYVAIESLPGNAKRDGLIELPNI